jgi:CubicO group peptidase (beta-lactamase class C family)
LKGEFGWSGAASTHLIIDPEKDIVGIFLTQKLPDDRIFYNEFITMTYQALIKQRPSLRDARPDDSATYTACRLARAD